MGVWLIMCTPRLKLTSLDALLGFSKCIEATWFFSQRIEPTALRASLDRLAARYPCLATRIKRQQHGWKLPTPLHGWQLSRKTQLIPLHCRTEPGTSWEAAAMPEPAASFTRETSGSAQAIMAGRAPVMAASLTNFASGGSALHVQMSHALVDAAGFYQLMGDWSSLHLDDEIERPPLEMRRDCVQASVLAMHSAGCAREGPPHFDLRTWKGSALFWLLQALTPRQVRRRVYLPLSATEVDELRCNLVAAGGSRRPSTNEALVASAMRATFTALRLPPSTPCQLQMVFDVRRAARLPSNYAGNAFHMLESPPTSAAPDTMPVAEVCAIVRGLALRAFVGNTLEDPHSLLGAWLQHSSMLERGLLPSRSPPAADHGRPAIHPLVANYQAHLPAFQVAFGHGGECLRVVPGAGDSIQLVAGPRGGVDMYLGLGSTDSLHAPRPCWERLRETVVNPAHGGG